MYWFLHSYMSVCMHVNLRRPKEGVGFLKLELQTIVSPYVILILCLLEEQPVLATTALSLQSSPKHILNNFKSLEPRRTQKRSV